MPMDRSLYPKNWEAVSLWVRIDRALHRCECTGQCGRHKPILSKSFPHGERLLQVRRCTEINKQRAKHANGRIILTAAHTCNCQPLCADVNHLLAMCQGCHLRFDMARHRDNRLRTISNPSYKTRRYREAAKAFHIEDLDLIEKLPAKKRRRPWINPL